MTALVPPISVRTKAALPELQDEERFIFYNVDWRFYEQVLRALDERRVFATYYRGTLEVMSPSYEHGWYGERLALLIRLLADELNIELVGGGSTTFRRRRVSAGLEPDRCFYIRNVASILGKRQLDLNVDPPPDLAVEVEISRRLDRRVSVYEALRVPELWRYDGRALRVFELGGDGTYIERDHSIAFPTLPLEQVHQFLQMGWEMGERDWDRAIRAWLRRNLPKAKPGRRTK
jgi:Uma2 family endonuclease